MASCISMSAPRYRILITVQHCLANSITKTPKQLCCRELRTCFVPNFSVLPVIRNSPVACRSTSTLWTPVLPTIQNDAIFYTRCNKFSSGSTKSDETDDLLAEKKMTRFQKMKYLWKRYWYIVVPVHVGTSIVWFGSFYYLSVSGIDIARLMECIGAPDSWVETFKNSSSAHFLTSYTLYKLATPLRYAVTISGSTLSINFLKQRGMLKPVPNKDELKRMFQERKGAFKDFVATCEDKIQTKKGDFLKTKEEIKQHYVDARDELQKSVIDTKRELKKGAKEVSSEWKHVGGLFYKSLKELSQTKPKADYVAKLIKETGKK